MAAMTQWEKSQNEVQKALQELMKQPECWFHRFPDAKTCHGRIKKQPADFLFMVGGRSILLEVKAQKGTGKVSKGRMTQSSKMKRFVIAGGNAYYIVHYYESSEWALLDLDGFELYRFDSAKGLLKSLI